MYVCIYVVTNMCTYIYLSFLYHPIIAVTVETTYYGITILQGDDVTLSCTPSESDITLQWSYNGSDISSSPQYQFNPPLLNHDLTIFNASVTDSGSYVCAIELLNIQETIALTVVASKCDYVRSKYKI